MPRCSTSRNVQLPIAHEHSYLASPRERDSVLRQYRNSNQAVNQQSSDKSDIQEVKRSIEKIRRRILGGSVNARQGWPWMYPTHVEGDSSLAYKSGFCMYLSALNPLVVTGMTDIVSNATVTSCQGIWLAMQDIPAAVGGKWNVPTLNYPSGAAAVGGSTFEPGTTAPSGTPLIGDMDLVDPTTGKPVRYWEYLGDIT